MTKIIRSKEPGQAWLTTEDDGGGGGSLPAQWTDGGNGDVTAAVDDETKTPFTIDLIEDQTGQAWRVRDADGNTLVEISANGRRLTVQDANGDQGINLSSLVGFQSFNATGLNVRFGLDGGISVTPSDPGGDALHLDGLALDPAQGAAMIVLENPIGDMPDGFYEDRTLTINADLTAGAAKLLIKARDTDDNLVSAEIPLA